MYASMYPSLLFSSLSCFVCFPSSSPVALFLRIIYFFLKKSYRAEFYYLIQSFQQLFSSFLSHSVPPLFLHLSSHLISIYNPASYSKGPLDTHTFFFEHFNGLLPIWGRSLTLIPQPLTLTVTIPYLCQTLIVTLTPNLKRGAAFYHVKVENTHAHNSFLVDVNLTHTRTYTHADSPRP